MLQLSLEDVILNPLLTEKSSQMTKKYLFAVHKFANKKMVKEALEKQFDVKVAKVNSLVKKGRKKRIRIKRAVSYSMTSVTKKVVVTLKSGKFPFIESENN